MNTRHVMELLSGKEAEKFLAAYSVWESGKDRFAITPGRRVVPVLGYVSRKADDAWFAESHGRMLPGTYSSLIQAARALASAAE